MKRLNQGQKITIIGVAVLLLLSLSFPPWKSLVSYRNFQPISESCGYRFILAPPEGFDVSLDLGRLFIQLVIIMLAGFIAFCVLTWRRPGDIPKPSAQPLPEPTGVDDPRDQSTTPSRFKDREKYEVWKSERLELLSKKEHADERVTPSPKISTRWLSFYSYAVLPFCILTSFVPPLAQYDKLIEQGHRVKLSPAVFVPIVIADILICFLIYGLHKRYLWAWTANWILLAAVVLLAPFNSAKETGIYLATVILLGIVFFAPNYFYFKKRRILFR